VRNTLARSHNLLGTVVVTPTSVLPTPLTTRPPSLAKTKGVGEAGNAAVDAGNRHLPRATMHNKEANNNAYADSTTHRVVVIKAKTAKSAMTKRTKATLRARTTTTRAKSHAGSSTLLVGATRVKIVSSSTNARKKVTDPNPQVITRAEKVAKARTEGDLTLVIRSHPSRSAACISVMAGVLSRTANSRMSRRRRLTK